MVTISILIATYNRAGLLDECLTHLERQTFDAGDEVIIVNNGSTDQTGRSSHSVNTRFACPCASSTSRALANHGRSHAAPLWDR